MYTYDTVTAAVKGLKQRGYTIDFNLEADCISCSGSEPSLKPSEFVITEVYRFEGESDPGDEAVVYAIESKDGRKGILVNGFGISADELGEEMVEKLAVRH
ncbi:MAG TPA: hypothetical protein VHD83_06805 [Puia sp.]|nr:hypothetical protein [Puia sp.]